MKVTYSERLKRLTANIREPSGKTFSLTVNPLDGDKSQITLERDEENSLTAIHLDVDLDFKFTNVRVCDFVPKTLKVEPHTWKQLDNTWLHAITKALTINHETWNDVVTNTLTHLDKSIAEALPDGILQTARLEYHVVGVRSGVFTANYSDLHTHYEVRVKTR